MNAHPAALALVAPAAPLAALGPELASARSYAAASRAENTRKAYASDVEAFRAWCEPKGLPSLPADGPTVALYLAALADEGRAVATIGRALVAINPGLYTKLNPAREASRVPACA